MERSYLSKQDVIIWLNAWLEEKYPDFDAMISDDLLVDSGLSSIESVELCFALSEQIGVEVEPTSIWDYPSLEEFSNYVQELQTDQKQPDDDDGCDLSSGATVPQHDASESLSVNEYTARANEEKEPIAIVGMSGRFPMAEDIDAFWSNLVEGKDCISTVPDERWSWQDIFGDPTCERNKTNIKWGGFISSVDEFDPLFFGISPREAELMDPQQRLAMTYACKAIEDAGYSPSSLTGTKTGVFIGTGSEGYAKLVERANLPIEGATATGLVPSIGPNRISYFLNLHGPSEPIETACSSSLVALHRARESINSGSCDMAIVGGVNTIVTPDFHISFSKAGMLSEDGRCKTFSEHANGYVRSEGVGMLFVKRLSAAERDGDHIYGLVRGSAENHGGRSKSLTAPNFKAQAELLKSAYGDAGVNVNDVSYIETHGTGTKLGDPIEINGLKAAFSDMNGGDSKSLSTQCALGAVKSNIGHLELAAGIAGVVKVLLQLKHNTLVKSLHCDELNPYIKLEDSQFYILQDTQYWPSAVDENGQRQARIAGVSSFGFGGVNAHTVIEEYIPKIAETTETHGEEQVIVVLSSRTETQLQEQANELLMFLENNLDDAPSVADVAFTLQVGRDHMAHRLAFVANSVEEIIEKLQLYKDDVGSDELYCGEPKESLKIVKLFDDDSAIQDAVASWIENKNYSSLLSLWVIGLEVDWKDITYTTPPSRISLPGYAFAKERYWIQADEHTNINVSQQLHPFVHRNTSTLLQQRFTTEFSGNEEIFVDHQISGQRVLPGVAYLEWIYSALEHSLDDIHNSIIGFHNVVWVRPIILDGAKRAQFHIDCSADSDDEISIEIYSETGDEQRVVHLQCVALISEAESRALYRHDLAMLTADCQRFELSAEQSYRFFSANDFKYGPSQQGIQHVYVGDRQIVAHLQLPECSQLTYTLHPCLFDSALQASFGFMIESDDLEDHPRLAPHMPFALQEVLMHAPLESEMWAVLKFSGNSAGENRVSKIDIDFCNADGVICAQIKGYTHKEIGTSVNDLTKPVNELSRQLSADEIGFFEQDYLEILAKVRTESMSKESFNEMVLNKIDE